MKNATNKILNPIFTTDTKSLVPSVLFEDIDCSSSNNVVYIESGQFPKNAPPSEAVSYAKMGWAVFPVHCIQNGTCSCGNVDCKSKGKHPLTKNGVCDATNDLSVINEWFTRWPNANIGIATGKLSGVVVLDVDPRHGGNVALEELEKKHGKLPVTVESITGGGGSHLFFRYPGITIRNSAGKVGSGLDVRGDGGYIVAPPGSHLSGNNYCWKDGFVVGEMTLAEIPEWLKELMLGNGNTKVTATHGEKINHPGWVSEALSNMSEGNRNDTFTKLTGKCHRGGLSHEDIVSLLEPHAEKVDFPLQELETLVGGVCKRYPNSFTSSLSPNECEDVKLLQPVCLANCLEPKDTPYLIESLCPEGHMTVMYADGGIGKSLLAIAIAQAVATGTPFLGYETKKKPVLYLDWELHQAPHLRRAYKIARGVGDTKPAADFYYLNPPKTIKGLIPDLKKMISEQGFGLLIIDSVGAAAGMNAESAQDVVELFQELNSLGVTILAIDHQSKIQEGQNYKNKTIYGSVYKYNLARSVFQLCKQPSLDADVIRLVIKPTKNNFGCMVDPFGVAISFDGTVIYIESDSVELDFCTNSKEKIIQYLKENGPKTKAEIAKDLNIRIGTVGNALTALKTKGGIYECGKVGRTPQYNLTDSSSSSHSLGESEDKIQEVEKLTQSSQNPYLASTATTSEKEVA